MPKLTRLCLLTLSLLALASAAGEAARRMERVQFLPGVSETTVNGRIKGDDGVSYEVEASKGQMMSVSFAPENPSCHFNVLPPGSDKALHDGASQGNKFSGTLAESGEYVTEVYLAQEAAQRLETCEYSITFDITG